MCIDKDLAGGGRFILYFDKVCKLQSLELNIAAVLLGKIDLEALLCLATIQAANPCPHAHVLSQQTQCTQSCGSAQWSIDG